MTERIPARSGAAEADQKGAQKQHVDMYRKILLRRQLLDALGDTRGAAYVPFIGDGDIAAEVYANRFIIFGRISIHPESRQHRRACRTRRSSSLTATAGRSPAWTAPSPSRISTPTPSRSRPSARSGPTRVSRLAS